MPLRNGEASKRAIFVDSESSRLCASGCPKEVSVLIRKFSEEIGGTLWLRRKSTMVLAFASVYILSKSSTSSIVEHGRPQFHTLPAQSVKPCFLLQADGAYFDGLATFKSNVATIDAPCHILLNDTPFSAVDKDTGS